jgi:hypothetical protein
MMQCLLTVQFWRIFPVRTVNNIFEFPLSVLTVAHPLLHRLGNIIGSTKWRGGEGSQKHGAGQDRVYIVISRCHRLAWKSCTYSQKSWNLCLLLANNPRELLLIGWVRNS